MKSNDEKNDIENPTIRKRKTTMTTNASSSSLASATRNNSCHSFNNEIIGVAQESNNNGNDDSSKNKKYEESSSSSSVGVLISAMSNLSIQYNMGVIVPALLLLDPRGVGYSNDNNINNTSISSPPQALYPRSDTIDSVLKSSVFIGVMFGQCTMGFFADIIGSISIGTIVTNALAFVGTLGCAFAPYLGGDDTNQVYLLLIIFRGIMGIGIGGKYPLASAIRAETAEEEELKEQQQQADENVNISVKDHRATEVARGFFWQTPGAILPYVVFLVVLLLLNGEDNDDEMTNASRIKIQYVLLVGSGMIPSLVVVVASWKRMMSVRNKSCNHQLHHRSIKGSDGGKNEMAYQAAATNTTTAIIPDQDNGKITQPYTVWMALRNRQHWSKLIGTGLSWALYDFVYYGTAFNQPEILSSVLGEGGGLVGSSWRNVVVGSMGIPGVICAIKMMGPMGGPKPLQGWGFVSIGIASIMVAFFYGSDGAGTFGPLKRWGGFLSCCLLIFSLNWGCNVSTYVLPIETFPKDVRSSFHGVSAGMGKLGALLGSFCFTKLNAISVSLTFYVCLVSCMAGVCVTWLFVDPPGHSTFFVKKEHSEHSKDSDGESKQLISPLYIDVE